MTKVALKGLAARKRRAATLVVAVFLGVALTAGAFVLTDTINASFEDIFESSFEKIDVVVTPREIVEQEDQEPPPFDASLLDQVKQVDGVAEAEGAIFSLGRIVDEDGDTIGAQFSPNFISSVWSPNFETFTYVEGRPPRTADEAAIDTNTADRGNLEIGDMVGAVGERELKRYRIVGITKLGETDFGGAANHHADARRGAADDQARERVRPDLDQGRGRRQPGGAARARGPRVLPNTVDVRTGEEQAAQDTQEIKEDLSFLTIFLLVFAGVAVVVGGFLIFNTFSITIAQRIREFGLLRTLGATRRQVLTSVVVEAMAIGAIGSLLGLAGGLAFAPAINALFESIGADLPNTGTVLATRTIVVALLVGMLVTLLSVLSPALRATRVTPMAALLEAELPESHRRGRIVSAIGVLLVVLGVVLVCIGLFGGIESSGEAAGLMGFGAAATLFGVAIFSPTLVRPLASVAGKPIERLRGLTGRLARENAMRKPGRTAATAASLMIGLALVSFVTVFASGISASVDDAIDTLIAGDVVVQNKDGFSPIPADVERDVASVDGVEQVTTLGYSTAGLLDRGDEQRISGIDPATARGLIDFDVKKGKGPYDWGRRGGHRRGLRRLRGLRRGGHLPRADAHRQARDLSRGRARSRTTPTSSAASSCRSRSCATDYGFKQASLVVAGFAPGADPERHLEGGQGPGRQALPDRRGARPGRAQGEPARAAEPATRPDLRAARPGGDRVDLRDREHAGALDPRAHARARAAARGRHVAPPGPARDPLRGGDHRADRGDPRLDPGHRLLRPDLAPAGRRGLHALVPGRLAARAADPRRARGRAGRDRPGAPRLEARRARGARLRVNPV